MRGASLLAAAAIAAIAGAGRAAEPAATFSIVALDPATGELGIAVQSKFFAVGAVVPWARAGVGAVATQAFANTTYGPRGLELLAAGGTATGALAALLAPDPGAASRQVGIVDARGGVAAHTGKECQPWAGHVTGETFTVQGNILTGPGVVDAMADAFRSTEGMLGERLMRALEAGQAAGGDSRGVQSAALLIVKEGAGYAGFDDRWCDLRVDDHADPIGELRRIFDLWKVNALVLEGYRRVEAGDWDSAIAAGEQAVALDARSGEPHYHLACYLSRAGLADRAIATLSEAARRDPALAARAATDPDFEPLAEREDFRALVGAP